MQRRAWDACKFSSSPTAGALLGTPGSGYFVKVAEPRLRWLGRSRYFHPRCGSLAGLAVLRGSGGMTVLSR
jgi:hypothetical protein